MSIPSIDLEAQLIERVVEKRSDILREADRRAEKIIEAAEEKVNKIKADSEKRIHELAGSELKAVRDRIIGTTELEGRKILMLTRQEILSNVFEMARKRILDIAEGKEGEYGEILKKIILETVSAIGGDEFVISANERDLAYLNENIGGLERELKKELDTGTLTLDEDPVDIQGGVIVRNKDGTKTFYNSLEGRIENVRSKVEARVGEIVGVI